MIKKINKQIDYLYKKLNNLFIIKANYKQIIGINQFLINIKKKIKKMGVYLSHPSTTKTSEEGSNNKIRFAASSMQGMIKKKRENMM